MFIQISHVVPVSRQMSELTQRHYALRVRSKMSVVIGILIIRFLGEIVTYQRYIAVN